MKQCFSLWSKFRGLMFSRKKDLVFVFNEDKFVSLHSWFCFFPIFVFYLNKNKRVVEKTVLNPFSVYRPKNKARFVVEFSEKKNFKKNNKIVF